MSRRFLRWRSDGAAAAQSQALQAAAHPRRSGLVSRLRQSTSGELGPVGDAQLVEDVKDVRLDGRSRHEETVGDLSYGVGWDHAVPR
jgi:hypothetical protein